MGCGVEQTPRLHETVREGKDHGGEPRNRRGRVIGTNAVSLQTPALFDLRAEHDRGLRFK
jgi:hypothetical protein